MGGLMAGSVLTMIAVALTMKKISNKNTMSIMGDMSNAHSGSALEVALRSFEEAMS
jgi:hypothetical protein